MKSKQKGLIAINARQGMGVLEAEMKENVREGLAGPALERDICGGSLKTSLKSGQEPARRHLESG